MHQPETSTEPGTARLAGGSTWLLRLGVLGATALATCLGAAPAQASPLDNPLNKTEDIVQQVSTLGQGALNG
ncbi:hypothetical protein ABZ626_09270 [Streptomyces longispororuber]|uniref:hypothetical protein n=1 Tax=Streptomyces longispororuber TaxID=68230 RepID=UPI00340AD4D3